jgi:Ca2+-binding EF-hand superfamily protein
VPISLHSLSTLICSADGNGTITSKELGQVMAAVGKTPTEEQLKAMVRRRAKIV